MAAATANGTTATKIATPGGEDDNVIWKGDTTTAVKRSSAGAGAQDPAAQWTITNNGQIFDPKSGSTWEIADEVLKLQISDDAAAAPTEIAEKSSTTDNSPSGKGSTSALAPAIDLDKPSAPRQASADGDDVSSSDSSSLATPANRMPGSKIVNGNQKVKKEPFASNGAIPPYGTFDEGLYNPSLMGAPVPQSLPQHYPLPSGALPSPLMSGFPHHIQTMHGPVPPPLFSPHQIAPQTAMHDGSLGSGPRASNGQLASFAPMHDASLQHPLSPYSRPSYPGSPPPATPYSNPMSPTLSPTTYMSHPYPSGIHAPLNYPYGAPPMAATQSPGYEYLTGPLDDPRNAAMAGRSQFRGHQHSASDTAALRDPAGDVAGVNGAMGQTPSHSHSQSLTLSPYSPVPGSPYGPHSPAPYQSFYAALPPGHITQQQQDAINAMTRASPYATNGPPAAAYLAAIAAGVTDPAALALVQSGAGPSANNRKLGLYKTELCRSWEEKGSCRYGAKCQFAHGEDEIRKVSRHPKYKTEICRTFWVSGSCPYGKRCCFIHTELPAAGAPGAPPPNGDAQRPGSTGAPGAATTPAPANGNPTPGTDGRARSMSTNSDPNDAPSSLLARISAKAQANNAAAQAANRSSEASPANGSSYNQDQVTANAIAQAYAQYGRPASGALLPGNTETSTVVPDKFPTANGNIGGHSGSGLGHHRVSASVDFSGHRTMADFSSPELGGGLGHQRNPSASAIHPQLSNFGQLMSSRVGQGGTRGSGDANGTPNRNSPSQGSRFSHERSQSGGVSRTVGSTFSTWAS